MSQKIVKPQFINLSAGTTRFSVAHKLDEIVIKYIINRGGNSRAVKRRASNLNVPGSTIGVDEIFVRCFSVSPTHMESEKKRQLALHA